MGQTITQMLSARLSVKDFFPAGFDMSATATIDCSAAFQAAIDALKTCGGGILRIPVGTYRICVPLDMTEMTSGIIVEGEGMLYSRLYADTGETYGGHTGVCIDTTGSQYVMFRDFEIRYGANTPSAIGILQGRSSTASMDYAQFHNFENIFINMGTAPTFLSGKGNVGVFNLAAEEFRGTNLYVIADNPLVLTSNYAKDWVGVPPTHYTTSSYVLNGGVYYQCIVTHDSGDHDDEPGVGAVWTTYWIVTDDIFKVSSPYAPAFSTITSMSVVSLYSSALDAKFGPALSTHNLFTLFADSLYLRCSGTSNDRFPFAIRATNSFVCNFDITIAVENFRRVIWTDRRIRQSRIRGTYIPLRTWTALTPYSTYNHVKHGGVYYRCILGHTSSAAGAAGNEPGVGATWATYWVEDGSFTGDWVGDSAIFLAHRLTTTDSLGGMSNCEIDLQPNPSWTDFIEHALIETEPGEKDHTGGINASHIHLYNFQSIDAESGAASWDTGNLIQSTESDSSITFNATPARRSYVLMDRNGTTVDGAFGVFGTVPVAKTTVADPAAMNNTLNEIGGLTISIAYSQAEVQALRDKCEELAGDVRAIHAKLGALIDALQAVGLV